MRLELNKVGKFTHALHSQTSPLYVTDYWYMTTFSPQLSKRDVQKVRGLIQLIPSYGVMDNNIHVQVHHTMYYSTGWL